MAWWGDYITSPLLKESFMPRKKATKRKPRKKTETVIPITPPFIDSVKPEESPSDTIPVIGDVKVDLSEITETVIEDKPEYIPTTYEIEQDLRKELLVDMPTKLELRRPNAACIDKLINWEEKNSFTVIAWRVARKDLGMKTNLEFIRPLGMKIDDGQLLKKTKV